MPEGKSLFREVLPKQEKLEKMQRAAQETIRQQEVAQREQQQQSQQ